MKKAPLILLFAILFFIGMLYIVFPLKKVEEAQEPNQVVGMLTANEVDEVEEVVPVEIPEEVEEVDNSPQEEQEETPEEKPEPPKEEEKPKKKTKATKIIKYARSKLNKPYRQAGTTDKGYDCSGLIMVSYKKEGYNLPRASYEMAKKGKQVKLKDAKLGDLIFFATKPNQPKKVSHVGMVTSLKGDKVYFIHSSEKAGVIINTLDEGYYKKRFLKIKRYLKDE